MAHPGLAGGSLLYTIDPARFKSSRNIHKIFYRELTPTIDIEPQEQSLAYKLS